jgi:hypothetical protein
MILFSVGRGKLHGMRLMVRMDSSTVKLFKINMNPKRKKLLQKLLQ